MDEACGEIINDGYLVSRCVYQMDCWHYSDYPWVEVYPTDLSCLGYCRI